MTSGIGEEGRLQEGIVRDECWIVVSLLGLKEFGSLFILKE